MIVEKTKNEISPFDFEDWNPVEIHGDKSDDFNGVRFGVELEYEFKPEFSGDILKIGKCREAYYSGHNLVKQTIEKISKSVGRFCTIKYDNSLTCGFEIASTKMSYNIHFALWQEFFKDLTDLPIISADTCGMHVHVDGAYLSPANIEFIRGFFANDKNLEFLYCLAGRKQNKYCVYKCNDKNPHYNAINTYNGRTVEFRIFSTPQSFNSFCAKIEFVKAIIDYSKFVDLSLEDKNADYFRYEVFVSFLQIKSEDYPNLISFIDGIYPMIDIIKKNEVL